jgi:hypothetical protein
MTTTDRLTRRYTQLHEPIMTWLGVEWDAATRRIATTLNFRLRYSHIPGDIAYPPHPNRNTL